MGLLGRVLRRRDVRDRILDLVEDGAIERAVELARANRKAMAKLNVERFTRRIERIRDRKPNNLRRFRVRLLEARIDFNESVLEV